MGVVDKNGLGCVRRSVWVQLGWRKMFRLGQVEGREKDKI